MADSRRLNILIEAKNNANKELDNLNSKVQSLKPTFRKMALIGTASFTGISIAIKKVTGIASELEQQTVAFETMLGSAEKAKSLLEDLSRFASTTPFEIQGIRGTAKQLMAMGIEEEKLIDTMKALGDISAGTSAPLERIALNFGQVKTQGKLTGRELRDFAVNGVPLIEALAQQFDVSKTKIQEMVSEGKVGFADVEQAFINMTSEGGKFANLMDKQSQTTAGQISNLKDEITLMAESVGQTLLPTVKNLLEKIKPVIEKVSEWIKENPELTKKIILVSGAIAGLTTVVGLLGLALPVIISGFSLLLSPVGLVIGAITALIIVFRKDLFSAFKDGGEKIRNFVDMLNEKTGVVDFFKNSFEKIVSVFQEYLLPAIQRLFDALEPLKPVLEILAKIVGVFLLGALVAVAKIIEISVIAGVKILTGAINRASKAVEIFNDIWNGVVSTFKSVVSWAQKVINKIREMNVLKGVRDKISDFSSRVFGGGRARGGYVSSKKGYIVGEKGPELFTPSSSGNIIPNNKLKDGRGGQTINITVNGDISGEDLIEKVSQGIMRNLSFNTNLNI